MRGLSRLELAGLVCVLLTGCAMEAVAPPPAVAARTSCPPVRSYSAAEQKALADALRPLPEGSPLVLAMRDYAALRNAAWACAETAP